jgi:hypothetical protein
MQIHSENFQSVNGSKPVGGRGIKRRKLSLDEQIKLAADLATGERPFMPSVAQACMLVDVPQRAVAAELKARAARKNGQQPPKAPTAAIGVGAVWDVLVA